MGPGGELRVEYLHERVYLWDGKFMGRKRGAGPPVASLCAPRPGQNGQPEEISWTLHARRRPPLLSSADVVELLRHFLPAGAVTPEEVLRQLQLRHKKRQASIDSARRVQVPMEQPPELLR